MMDEQGQHDQVSGCTISNVYGTIFLTCQHGMFLGEDEAEATMCLIFLDI